MYNGTCCYTSNLDICIKTLISAPCNKNNNCNFVPVSRRPKLKIESGKKVKFQGNNYLFVAVSAGGGGALSSTADSRYV